jgi:hypothetical protein
VGIVVWVTHGEDEAFESIQGGVAEWAALIKPAEGPAPTEVGGGGEPAPVGGEGWLDVCLDPVEDAGIMEDGEPSRLTAALDLGKYELVGFSTREAAGDDGGELEAEMKIVWPALRARLGGVVIIIIIIVVSLFQVTVDEMGEVGAVVVRVVVVIIL